MVRLGILISLCFFSLFADTNASFLVRWHKPFDTKLYSVVENYDGSVSATGYANSYKKNKPIKTYTDPFDYLHDLGENRYGKKAVLVRFDPDSATLLQERFARIEAFNEAVSILKTPQNGYFLGGYTFDGSLLLAKLDENADTVFVQTFGTKNYDRMHHLVALSDGGVLAVGSSTTSRDTFDPMFRTGLGLNDIFLTRFDKNGRMLWSKKYGTSFDDSGIDAVEASDGSIVVLAETTYDKHHDVTLLRIGENGNKIWLKQFKLQKLVTPKKLLRLHDDTFIAVLSQRDAVGKKEIRLVRFDLQKNLLKDKTLLTRYASELNDIYEYANGTLAAVGATQDRYNTDALFMVLDESFEILCQEHFGGDNIDLFTAMTILRNGTAMAVGYSIEEGMQVSSMFVAKINRNCTLAKRQEISPRRQYQTQTAIYRALQKAFNQTDFHGRLSIDSALRITFSSPTLTFPVGDANLTAAQKTFLKKFTNKLLPVLERFGDKIENLEIIGHTSSIWNGAPFTKRYNNNMSLSLQRAQSVSSYMMKTQKSRKKRRFLAKILKDSGRSFADAVIRSDGKEALRRSQRITFRIILKNAYPHEGSSPSAAYFQTKS